MVLLLPPHPVVPDAVGVLVPFPPDAGGGAPKNPAPGAVGR